MSCDGVIAWRFALGGVDSWTDRISFARIAYRSKKIRRALILLFAIRAIVMLSIALWDAGIY